MWILFGGLFFNNLSRERTTLHKSFTSLIRDTKIDNIDLLNIE